MNLQIPTNLFPSSYSGMGSAWQDFSQNQALPAVSNMLTQYPDFINQAWNGANNGMQQFTQNALKPAMQNTVNGLNSKGMLDSSVASDALAQTMSNVGNQVLGLSANNEAAKASMLGQYPAYLNKVAGLGQYSESSDPSAPYTTMANLLAQLL